MSKPQDDPTIFSYLSSLDTSTITAKFVSPRDGGGSSSPTFNVTRSLRNIGDPNDKAVNASDSLTHLHPGVPFGSSTSVPDSHVLSANVLTMIQPSACNGLR